MSFSLLRILKSSNYILKIPQIIGSIKNWPTFILNWTGIVNTSSDYYFRNGIIIKTGEGIDTCTINTSFISQVYDEFNIINQVIDKNSVTIIDIGGNIGVFSIYVKRKFPQAKIYAYEPVPANFHFLINNIKINKFEKDILAFQLGVCGKNGKRKLYLKDSPTHSIFSDKKGSNDYIKIDCITLQNIFEQNNLEKCDVLKIDCEGTEYEILYNTPLFIFNKIKNIIIECHSYSSKKDYNQNSLKNFLTKMNFEINEKDNILFAKKINL